MADREILRALAVASLLVLGGGGGGASDKLETLIHNSLLDEMTGDFAEAADTLELVSDVSDDEQMNRRIARLLDRAKRALAFEDHLPELLSAKASKARPPLQFRDGTLCRFCGADSRQICVEIEGEQEMHSARELTPSSVLLLSAHVALTHEDALGRAFIALAEKDDAAFWAGIERAAADPKLKSSIDSAIAWRRDLDSVPPGGFVKVGAEWKAGSELALKKEIGDTSKLQQLMRSSKAADAEAARAKLEELMLANPDGLKVWALALRSELRAAFEKAPEQKALAALHERVTQLKKAREVALKLIFDEKRYFYPYRPPECPPEKAEQYAAVSAEVDALVANVRAIWGDEFGPAPEPSLRAANFLGVVTELKTLRTVLADLGVARDEVDAALAPCWLLPARCDAITVRNLAGDLYDVNRFAHDEPILAANRLLLPQKGGVTADELKQVEITNVYRAMMGRRALAWNPKLLNCARGHSEWMERTGNFSHFEEAGSPREEPSGRAKLAGYPGSASENIFFGDADPMRAHVCWIHSSGHHRNILLMDHTEMGAGRAGSYWTQNFGGSSEYKGNLPGAKH